MRRSIEEAFHAFILYAAAAAILFAAWAGFKDVFYQLAPMELWVRFDKVVMEPPSNNLPQRIHIWRQNRWWVPTISVTRYLKLQEVTPEGLVNRCDDDDMTTSDYTGRVEVFLFVDDLVRDANCDLSKMEGKTVNLQLTWRITAPGTHFKYAQFKLGRFLIHAGRFVQLPPMADGQPAR